MIKLWFYYTESEVLATMENICFICRVSSRAAARAVVTGVKPALMGTGWSHSSTVDTHGSRTAGELSLSGGTWEPTQPTESLSFSPGLAAALCKALTSFHNPTSLYFPFLLLSSATRNPACVGLWPITFPKEFTTHSFNWKLNKGFVNTTQCMRNKYNLKKLIQVVKLWGTLTRNRAKLEATFLV